VYIRTDVQSWSSLSKLFQTTLDACRQIDIVVANAGLQTTSFWKDKLDENGELQEPDWQVIDTNLKGIMATVKLSLHYFQQNKVACGRCVIVGSPDGYFRGSKQSGPNAEYVATEHGVCHLEVILTEDYWISESLISYFSSAQFTDICNSPMAYQNDFYLDTASGLLEQERSTDKYSRRCCEGYRNGCGQ
jgi:hypothetical protein